MIKLIGQITISLKGSGKRLIPPRFNFKEYSVDEVSTWVEELDTCYDPATESIVKPISAEADNFIRHEINRCKVDFRYWAERYAKVKDKQMNLVRLNPTAVQELLLDKISKAELEAISGKTGS